MGMGSLLLFWSFSFANGQRTFLPVSFGTLAALFVWLVVKIQFARNEHVKCHWYWSKWIDTHLTWKSLPLHKTTLFHICLGLHIYRSTILFVRIVQKNLLFFFLNFFSKTVSLLSHCVHRGVKPPTWYSNISNVILCYYLMLLHCIIDIHGPFIFNINFIHKMKTLKIQIKINKTKFVI